MLCRRQRTKNPVVLLLAALLLLGQFAVAPPAQAADISIFIDGVWLETGDAAPYIQDGRTMVPFRALFQALGATVEWDGERRAVTGSKGDVEIRLTIGSSTAYVDGSPTTLEVPGAIRGGHTYVPLRFVGEALGASVTWDGANSAVKINTRGAAAPATPAAPAAPDTPGSEAGAPTATKYVTITDDLNNVVRVPCPPKRIVVMNLPASEIICALGGADSVVGVSNSILFPPSMLTKKDLGNAYAPNLEMLLSLKPDVVILYTSSITRYMPGIMQKLQNQGIVVIAIDGYYMDSIPDSILTIGKILGREDQANDFLNNFYNKYLNLVSERIEDVPQAQRPRALFEWYSDYTAAGKTSYCADLVRAAGGRNIGDNNPVVGNNPKVSSEWLITQNPQFVFRSLSISTPGGWGQPATGLQRVRNQILTRPGWGNVTAIKSQQVYCLNDQFVTSPLLPFSVLYMARNMYPDRFQDIDFDAVVKDNLAKYFGVEPNGTWYYPPAA